LDLFEKLMNRVCSHIFFYVCVCVPPFTLMNDDDPNDLFWLSSHLLFFYSFTPLVYSSFCLRHCVTTAHAIAYSHLLNIDEFNNKKIAGSVARLLLSGDVCFRFISIEKNKIFTARYLKFLFSFNIFWWGDPFDVIVCLSSSTACISLI
jgi:hypothetical protein